MFCYSEIFNPNKISCHEIAKNRNSYHSSCSCYESSTLLSTLFTLLLIFNNNPRKMELLYSGPTVSTYYSEDEDPVLLCFNICVLSTASQSCLPKHAVVNAVDITSGRLLSRWMGSRMLN